MSAHRLTLTRTGPGWSPKCVCGWQGLPRSRHTAEAEYRMHRQHLEARQHQNDGPHPLTPFDKLPDELRAPHPDIAPYEQAVAEVVGRLSTS